MRNVRRPSAIRPQVNPNPTVQANLNVTPMAVQPVKAYVARAVSGAQVRADQATASAAKRREIEKKRQQAILNKLGRR
jgi:hypothetical protein